MKFTPHSYQDYAIRRLLDQEAAGLFLDMGLGKTVVTLTAIEELVYNRFEVARVLVIAPKRVAQDTWTREQAKWDHLQHLQVVGVLGTEKQRLKALASEADVYVINRENVAWLVGQYKSKRNPWPFDMIVVDELSSFKDGSSARFKRLRKVRPLARRVVGLTATPAPKGYVDLWSQIYLLDQGERLGKTVGEYRREYFHAGSMDRRTGVVFRWDLDDGAKERIDEKLRDLCVSMTAEDNLDMPEKIYVNTPVVLSAQERAQYKSLERDYLLSLDDAIITAGTAAAITNKLQQYAQGAAYTIDEETLEATGEWQELHSAKLDALEDIVEAANGQPVLAFYWFKHDAARIQARFPQARRLDGPEDIAAWNAGEIPLLLAHPASAGHGLNLQDGGSHVVWFSMTWDLELYQQANGRLYRQGQQARTVVIEHLVAEGTVDEDILAALDGKAAGQQGLIDALKARLGEVRP